MLNSYPLTLEYSFVALHSFVNTSKSRWAWLKFDGHSKLSLNRLANMQVLSVHCFHISFCWKLERLTHTQSLMLRWELDSGLFRCNCGSRISTGFANANKLVSQSWKQILRTCTFPIIPPTYVQTVKKLQISRMWPQWDCLWWVPGGDQLSFNGLKTMVTGKPKWSVCY